MDPITIGLLIVSGALGVAGLVQNQKSQRAHTLEIAQTRMIEQQRFEQELEYNDPKNVRARLEAAGINPQVAMSGYTGSFPRTNALPITEAQTSPLGDFASQVIGMAQISRSLKAQDLQNQYLQDRMDLTRAQTIHTLEETGLAEGRYGLEKDISAAKKRTLDLINAKSDLELQSMQKQYQETGRVSGRSKFVDEAYALYELFRTQTQGGEVVAPGTNLPQPTPSPTPDMQFYPGESQPVIEPRSPKNYIQRRVY